MGLSALAPILRSHLLPSGDGSSLWQNDFDALIDFRSEIKQLLNRCDIADVIGNNKFARLYVAPGAQQHKDNATYWDLAFVEAALNPVRYASSPALFDARRSSHVWPAPIQ